MDKKKKLQKKIKRDWFGLVWSGLVLWHINHFTLFNAKYSLYMYIN